MLDYGENHEEREAQHLELLDIYVAEKVIDIMHDTDPDKGTTHFRNELFTAAQEGVLNGLVAWDRVTNEA